MPKRYEAKKVGDQYVIVPQAENEEMNRVAWSAGGLLVGLIGLKRGGVTGLALAAAGGLMMHRGIMGYNLLSKLVCDNAGGKSGDPTQTPSYHHDWKRTDQVPADEVEEAAMESFPASDAPAHTPQKS